MQRLPGLLLTALLLITGLCVYRDYGVSWDEREQREIGRVNLEYIRSGNAALIDAAKDRDHGAAFEILLKSIEEAAGARERRQYIPLRHLCSFLFWVAGVLCGYLLALRLYGRQWLALAAILMLVLMPRIFAHAFFNSKDVPFLSAMLMALYAISGALDKQKVGLAIIAGMLCGFATGIRTMGGLLVAMTLVVYFIAMLDGTMPRKKALSHAALFALAAMAMLYACWPALWRHPISGLAESFHNLSRFTRFKSDVLFEGKYYAPGTLPLYYAPKWLAISTPLIWLALGVVGIAVFCYDSLRLRKAFLLSLRGKMLGICLGLVALPMLAVVAFHSILYDDWRHLYFIYPPLVMLGLHTAERIARLRRGKPAIITAISAQAACTAAFMISAHPAQQVYFNALVPRGPEYRRHAYEGDYWGLSYRQGLQWLLTHDVRDTIPVVDILGPVDEAADVLPKALRRRIRLTGEGEQGAYYLTTYRWHPDDYPYPKVWGLVVGGSTVMQVYKVDTAGRR